MENAMINPVFSIFPGLNGMAAPAAVCEAKLFRYIKRIKRTGGRIMRTLKNQRINSIFNASTAVVAAALFLILASTWATAEDKIVTRETLLDRIQIEDMIVKYYVDLSAGKSHDMAQYYTEDAILDVNGEIAKGRKEIE